VHVRGVAIAPTAAAQPCARCFAPPAASATAPAWLPPFHAPLDATILYRALSATPFVESALLQCLAILTAKLFNDTALQAATAQGLTYRFNLALPDTTAVSLGSNQRVNAHVAWWDIFAPRARRSRRPATRAPILRAKASLRALHAQRTLWRRRRVQPRAPLAAPGSHHRRTPQDATPACPRSSARASSSASLNLRRGWLYLE